MTQKNRNLGIKLFKGIVWVVGICFALLLYIYSVISLFVNRKVDEDDYPDDPYYN